ncbi:MAG: helix-turn-helix transcriptional regulator [Desulfobacterales bacterium]|nr:helix-turn-helix transcriptional regulator [Desulfobacterales bacterium]
MSDLKKYIDRRKERDKNFAENYEEGWHDFKIGVMIREAREQAGLTQKQLAERLKVKPPLISRLENNAGDVKLSTLHRIASGLNLHLNIGLSTVS